MNTMFIGKKPGESVQVTESISTIYEKITWYAERALSFSLQCDSLIQELYDQCVESEGNFAQSPKKDLFYTFDAFIVFSYSLFEKPLISDLRKQFSTEEISEFDKKFPERDNPNNILRRIEFLRDRLVHTDDPFFGNTKTSIGRFDEFRSKGVAYFNNGELSISSNLIDLKDHPEIGQAYITKGKKAKKPRFSELFSKPKSELEHSHPLLRTKLKTMDIYSGFYEILDGYLDAISCANLGTLRACKRHLANTQSSSEETTPFPAIDSIIYDLVNELKK